MTLRVLVTGANGYLGSQFITRHGAAFEGGLVGTWHSGTERIKRGVSEHVRYAQCDLAQRGDVEGLFRSGRFDVIVHSAALLPDVAAGYLSRVVEANIAATANLIDAAITSHCSRFVYCSSISVYGNARCPPGGWSERQRPLPVDAYGWSKLAGEDCLRIGAAGAAGAAALEGVALRFAGIHGPGRRSGVIHNIMSNAIHGRPNLLNAPQQPFQLAFIADAADALMLALSMPLRCRYTCLNVASHTFSTMEEMIARIACVREEPVLARTGAATAAGGAVMSLKAVAENGFKPQPLEQSLDETYQWIVSEEARVGGAAKLA